MGEMKAITNCRACGSTNLTEFLDLGKQYLSDFRDDGSKPPKYPLVAMLCNGCKLVQLAHTTPQPEMYHERYGFKSGVSDTIKADLDSVVLHAFQYINDPRRWLDIGSNDGTLLSFIPEDVYRMGVDPVTFLCDEARRRGVGLHIINRYFDTKVATMLSEDPGDFDVITTISCFYDMPNPLSFVQDVASVLGAKGVWIIQQNYLLTTIELNAVDNFCHEHLEYYTLLSLENLLERFGLEVNEVTTSSINGGSIRTVVSHKGTFPIDDSVERQRAIERRYGVDDLETYQDFANRIGSKLTELWVLVKELKAEGKSIAILAASTRGATIWQAANIDSKLVDYAVERNPAKVGRMFSAIGIPIISEEEAHERKPDVMLIGPWFNGDEIIKREADYLASGGSLVLPLPEITVIK